MLKPQWFWVWIIFTRQRSNSKMFFKQNHHYWLWKAVNPMWHHVRTPQFHQNEPLWYLGPTCSRPGSLVTPEAKSLSPRMLLHSSASRAHLCTTASLYGVNSHNNNHKKTKRWPYCLTMKDAQKWSVANIRERVQKLSCMSSCTVHMSYIIQQ